MDYKMDSKLKNSLVAAAVLTALSNIALSNTAFAATVSLPISDALPNFDAYAAQAYVQKSQQISKSLGRSAKQPETSSIVKQNRQKVPNLNGSGIKLLDTARHFDQTLNTSTFSWAKGQQKIAAKPFSVLNRQSAVRQASRGYAALMGAKHGVSSDAFAQAQLKYSADNKSGAVISKYQQRANGIEVYGRQFNVLMNQNMELVATTGYFANLKAPQQSMAGQFKLSAKDAITKAFANTAGGNISLTVAGEKGPYQNFSASSAEYTFSDKPRAKKIYYPGKKTLIPAYYVEVMSSKKGSKDLIAYSHVISAVDGKVLNRTNMVQRDAFTYKAFADSTAPYMPFDSPMGNDLTPHPTGVFDDVITETQAGMNNVTLAHSGISTNDPWLAAGATSTSGNNVDAYADLAAPDGFSEGDVRAQTTSANTFDYSFTQSDAHNTDENLNAAIVNLFYVNNYLHDLYYNHGFDEAAGVAQVDNFGRGGLDGDPIHAEAQDHSGINNATMATPADGASPRMHMFIWETDTIRDGTVDNAIIEHEWGHYISNRLTGGGMYANNQGGSMGEGWGDFFALMTMVREEDQLLAGNDQWQTTYNDGGYAVNNGFVEHAYFFGLRRLPYTTDMTHNSLTFKHIEDQVAVPTTHPYSNLYQASFWMDGVVNSEVHASGEIWALMLWESYAGLLNRDELSFEQAQNRMRDYMVASMKITPFAPTFTEARDALLAVALANDAEDYNVIRTAFAKRGMGATAKSPDRFDAGFDGTLESQGHKGVVESFDAEGSAVAFDMLMFDANNNTANGAFCDVDGVLDVGETGRLKVAIKNTATNKLSGIKAKVTSDADITFANDGMIEFDDLAQWRDTTLGTIEATLNQAGLKDAVKITVTLMSDDNSVVLPEPMTAMLNVNFDVNTDRSMETFDDAVNVWSNWNRTMEFDTGTDPSHQISQWEVSDDDDFGPVAWGPNLSQQNDISLVTPTVTVADAGEFAIEFEHYYEFELGDPNDATDLNAWDGGVMEISIDGGDWTDVTAAGGTFLTGYNGTIIGFNPVLGDREGFIGLIDSRWIAPEALTFADGVLNGKEVKFRFRIGSDGSVAAWGWNIDNVAFTNATNATPFGSLMPDSGVCVNRMPHVDSVTGPVNAEAGAPVTLTATSIDHDGTDLSYRWQQTSGSAVIDVSSTRSTLTFDAPIQIADETYTFSVTVSDGELSSAAREISVNVMGNSAPVVTTRQATASVKEQQSLALTVNGTDAEGDDLSYQWMMNGVAIDNQGTSFDFMAPAVTADTEVVFSVTAFDGLSNSEAIEMVVTVIANQAPQVTANQAALSVIEKASVKLAVTATDPEGDALTYQWLKDGVAIDNGLATYDFVAPAVSEDTTVIFAVMASDGDETSAMTEIVVTVIANQAPVVSANQSAVSVKEKASVTLGVNAVDPEGDALTYQWLKDGVAIDNGLAMYDFVAPAVSEDTEVVFNVIAFDGDETSAATEIVVTVVANVAAVVTANQALVNVKEQTSVTLGVTAIDPENDVLTYQWSMDGVAIDNHSDSYDFMAPAVSEDTTMVFSVVAFDGDESSDATQIEVTVVANKAPVVTTSQANVVIREGEDVTLSVAATDFENDALTYQWTKNGTDIGNNSTSLAYTGLNVNQDSTVLFSVTASDGDETSEPVQISVKVEDRSSGGSTGLLALLLSPLAFIRRRKMKK